MFECMPCARGMTATAASSAPQKSVAPSASLPHLRCLLYQDLISEGKRSVSAGAFPVEEIDPLMVRETGRPKSRGCRATCLVAPGSVW